MSLKQKMVCLFKEGKYVDIWTVNNILIGMLICIGSEFLAVEFWTSTLIALVLFLRWEIFEEHIKTKEKMTNRISDVIFGMLAYVLTYFYFIPWVAREIRAWFIFLLIIYFLIGFLGFMSNKFEKKNIKC